MPKVVAFLGKPLQEPLRTGFDAIAVRVARNARCLTARLKELYELLLLIDNAPLNKLSSEIASDNLNAYVSKLASALEDEDLIMNIQDDVEVTKFITKIEHPLSVCEFDIRDIINIIETVSVCEYDIQDIINPIERKSTRIVSAVKNNGKIEVISRGFGGPEQEKALKSLGTYWASTDEVRACLKAITRACFFRQPFITLDQWEALKRSNYSDQDVTWKENSIDAGLALREYASLMEMTKNGAQVLMSLIQTGVPQAEAEKIYQIYLRESNHVEPPPLPPRPDWYKLGYTE